MVLFSLAAIQKKSSIRITQKIDIAVGVVRQDLYGTTGDHTTVELRPTRSVR